MSTIRFKAKGRVVSFTTKKKGKKKSKRRRMPPRRKDGTFRKRR